jgi:hypothetical protein
MRKKIFISVFLASVFLSFLVLFQPAFAIEPLLRDTADTRYSGGCISDGNCQLNDFVVLAIRVSQIILALTGSLSLLALIYGGVLFLISAGNTERVSKAKSTIFYAVIGIAVVFFSYTIIAFIYRSLGLDFNPLEVF